MQKHLKDFEREITYNESRQSKEIKKELAEQDMKKKREKMVFQLVE